MNPADRLLELDSAPLWLNADEAAAARGDSNSDAAIRDRVRAWDERIVSHLQDDLDPPPELKGQILAAIQAASTKGTSDRATVGVAAETPADESEPSGKMSRRLFNRWSIGIAVSAACLGLIGLALSMWGADPIEQAQIIQDVESSLNDPIFMEPAKQGEAPQGMGVPTQYLAENSKGFRQMEILGSPVVAHDLRLGTPVARLFVIRTSQDVTPELVVEGPPINPQSDTNGRCIGVWRSKEKDLVYVLVVHGSKDDYRRLVRRQSAA